MAEHSSISDAAQAYLSAGLCVLPAIRAEKRPAIGRWKQYQTRRPTKAELSAWFANGQDAICILCGAVSGNAEMIDFDGGGELFDAWCKAIPADLLCRSVIEASPSGGWHVVYRCKCAICGNLKLAQRKDGEKIVTLIETRGEGGLFLCAPTPGYELMQGDLCDLPVLTAEQRDILLQAAWALNEYQAPVAQPQQLSANRGEMCATVGENGNLREHNSHNDQFSEDNSHNCRFSAENSHNRDSLAHNSHNGPLSEHNSHNGQFSEHNSHNVDSLAHNAERPGDDFNNRGDVRDLLQNHGWVRVREGENEHWRRPCKDSGWSATLKDRVFYVFSSNAAPFEPNQAYSPFSVYTWLEHGGDFEQAARSLRELGYGGDCATEIPTDVDISAIVGMSVAQGHCGAHNSNIDDSLPENTNPGPIPEHLFHIPGFIGEVVDFCLAAAPYPNLAMAFCGALALQSHLCARKVREPGDLRTNLYILALTGSSGGKNFPRHINTHVLSNIGQARCLGDKFASGEGIQDELHRHQAKLYQNDEIDGLIQAVNKSRDGRFESIMSTLLTMFTSANTLYPMRSKAGKDDAGFIDQPHLTIFGTATPTYYYESLSERMLTNGFFARMIIVDVGKRPQGQDPQPVSRLPERIIQTARWWHELQPGAFQGNLAAFHPEPNIIPYTDDAQDALRTFRRQADAEYNLAEDRRDEVAKTVWGRANENARKLALLYACSTNHEHPQIDMPAVRWAMQFVDHQIRRMLYMAGQYVSQGEFDALCKNLLRKLRETPTGRLEHSRLLKRMKVKAKDFRDLIETLVQRGDVEVITTPTKGRPNVEYAVKEGVSCG